MSSRISFNATTPHGKMLAELCDQILDTRATAVRLLRAADAMVLDTGSGPTWPQLEAEMGVTAGQAASTSTSSRI
jgi:hypothetical protein